MDSKVQKILDKFIKKTNINKINRKKEKTKKKNETNKSIQMIDGLMRSKSKNISYYAIEWLEFLRSTTGDNILHSVNGGEVVVEDPELKTSSGKFKKYYLDGFCQETNTIFEFYGSFTHGHIKTEKDKKNKLLLYKNKNTMERENRLRELGYNVISIWSNDWINSEERLQFLILQGLSA